MPTIWDSKLNLLVYVLKLRAVVVIGVVAIVEAARGQSFMIPNDYLNFSTGRLHAT